MKNAQSHLLKIWHAYIYKKGTQEIYWEKIISSTVVSIGLIIFLVNAYLNTKIDERKIQINTHYAIGITTGTNWGLYQSPKVYFKYRYKNEEYSIIDEHDFFQKFKKLGGRYIVKFSPLNLHYARILLNCPVPDSLQSFENDTGWTSIPCDCLTN